jgi:hypothetical protein
MALIVKNLLPTGYLPMYPFAIFMIVSIIDGKFGCVYPVIGRYEGNFISHGWNHNLWIDPLVPEALYKLYMILVLCIFLFLFVSLVEKRPLIPIYKAHLSWL